MRLLSLIVLLPLSALAHGVMIVPADENARTVLDGMVEQIGSGGFQLKMAGNRSPAMSCLKDKDPDKQRACLFAAAGPANVLGLLLVKVTARGRTLDANFEVLERATKTTVFHETLKAPQAGFQKAAAPLVKRMVSAMQLLKRAPQHTESPSPVVAQATPPEPPKATEPPRPVEPPQAAAPEEPAGAVKPQETKTDVPRKAEEPPRPVALVATTTAPPRVDFAAPKSRSATWAVTGVAAVAAGVAVVCGLLGASGKSRLEAQNNGVSNLSYSDAIALQGQANQQFTISMGSGIAAALSGGVAAYLWSTDP